jgi:hypothetical protein
MADWDETLWWATLSLGVAAAALSIATSVLDRRHVEWPTDHQRFLMHLLSYGLLSVSILGFVLRGLVAPA